MHPRLHPRLGPVRRARGRGPDRGDLPPGRGAARRRQTGCRTPAARAESAAAGSRGSAAVEAASQVPARAIERMPAAARAVELAAQRIPGVIRSTTGPAAGAGRPASSWPRSPPSWARWSPGSRGRGRPPSRGPRRGQHRHRHRVLGVRGHRGPAPIDGQGVRGRHRRASGRRPARPRRRSRDWPACCSAGAPGRSLSDMTDSAWAAWRAQAPGATVSSARRGSGLRRRGGRQAGVVVCVVGPVGGSPQHRRHRCRPHRRRPPARSGSGSAWASARGPWPASGSPASPSWRSRRRRGSGPRPSPGRTPWSPPRGRRPPRSPG